MGGMPILGKGEMGTPLILSAEYRWLWQRR